MKKKAFLALILTVAFAAGVSGQPVEFASLKVGVWIENERFTAGGEPSDLIDYLKTLNFDSLYIITTADIINKTRLFTGTHILWICKNDTNPFASSHSDKIFKRLKSYVLEGGKIILANQAMVMTPYLGLEDSQPETRVKKTVDEGYGRQLGFHAFRAHPLFDGMNGGAYILKPVKDTIVLQTGYFNDKIPGHGKVIGVDWDYIFLREESKLVIEYEAGKGKVLGIGGYLLFSMPNRNRVHLETFTANIFRHLSGQLSTEREFYWNYGTPEVLERSFSSVRTTTVQDTGNIHVCYSGLQIRPGKSSGNYWDLAGQRMLLMGTDHGGITEIWAHPVMSLRDYKMEFKFKEDDTLRDPALLNPEIEVLPWAYVRKYNLTGDLTGNLTGDLTGDLLGESITVSPDLPCAIIHYHYEGNEPVFLNISFRLLFRLMWPYSEKVLGNLYYSWNDDIQAFIATDESGDFVTVAGLKVNRDGISYTVSNPALDAEKNAETGGIEMPSQIMFINLKLPGPGSFDVIIASSGEGLEKTTDAYLKAASDPASLFSESQEHADSILQNSLMFASPDREFNDGYRWALLATERFQVNTPGIGSSLVAGYATSDKGWDGGHAVSGRPGYGWYFGRDGAWSGFALLHYGDFEKVKLMLEIFQRYQDLTGKIFHELSTSGIAHYDAADATPLYIILAGRYLKHSGDSAFIRQSWPYLKKAIDFCYSSDTDGDLLIENTNVGHGWVEGGHLFGSHTSLHLASCWAAALDEASYMAGALGLENEQGSYNKDATAVQDLINKNFWNPDKKYYYHGLMPDGSYMDNMSIMSCIPMLFHQADQEKVQEIMPVIAANGFTTDWGCRIVQEGSPHYNPGGYHTGSVWPLFTGWASLAEFAYGNYLQGYAHLMSNVLIFKYWGLGFIEEVLHGEIFQPFGVCHHQCWSETMALQPAIEGMLGYRPDALKHKLTLKPWFPADWDSVEVSGIRMGEEVISMEARRHGGREAGGHGNGEDERTVRQEDGNRSEFINTYFFAKGTMGRIGVNFQPVFPPGSMIGKIFVNGQPAKDWGVRRSAQGWVIPEFGFWLDSTALVEITWRGGITALPLIPHPEPGDRSAGCRIISTQYEDNTYTVHLEAPESSEQEIMLWAADPEKYFAEGAALKSIEKNKITLSVHFDPSENKYSGKEVILKYKQ
jgi:hypothetical protein